MSTTSKSVVTTTRKAGSSSSSSLSSQLLLLIIFLSGFNHHPTLAFSSVSRPSSTSTPSTSTSSLKMSADTPTVLPDFKTSEEYVSYMESVSSLPKGFATGTADGTFISQEAPGLGYLKIRATVIHLTDGPTDNWAACFTSNKVRAFPSFFSLPSFVCVCVCVCVLVMDCRNAKKARMTNFGRWDGMGRDRDWMDRIL